MDIKILWVKEHGNLSSERLLLEAKEDDVELRHYIVMDNTYDEEGNLTNKLRHCYDFKTSDVILNKGDRVALYTKKGNYESGSTVSGNVIHKIYWGLKETVWNEGGDIAYLVEVSGRRRRSV